MGLTVTSLLRLSGIDFRMLRLSYLKWKEGKSHNFSKIVDGAITNFFQLIFVPHSGWQDFLQLPLASGLGSEHTNVIIMEALIQLLFLILYN